MHEKQLPAIQRQLGKIFYLQRPYMRSLNGRCFYSTAWNLITRHRTSFTCGLLGLSHSWDQYSVWFVWEQIVLVSVVKTVWL